MPLPSSVLRNSATSKLYSVENGELSVYTSLKISSPWPTEDCLDLIMFPFRMKLDVQLLCYLLYTSDFYGLGHDNEIMIGKALKELPREKVQLCTKFGLVKSDGVLVEVKGTNKVRNLENNIGSLAVKLTNEEMREISDAVPVFEVAGKSDFAYGNMSYECAASLATDLVGGVDT
ncbi:hypothetical protein VNO77_12509 [Canavalia gladiata]|uniref:Uncharacterized protein n=1 Tax=Canavalia gladiata TaxID=3824 RepID=A0AAN9M0T0_CANGL